MATEAQIQARLFSLLALAPAGHGTNITIRALQATGTPNRYGQATKTYAAGVTLPGRGIIDPSQDLLTQIGAMRDEFDCMFLFSKQHLDDAFPAATPPDWMNVDDEIEFEGKRYAIVKVHPTGKTYGNYLLLIVLGVTLAGNG